MSTLLRPHIVKAVYNRANWCLCFKMFSIIVPLDPNRLEQFKTTKRAYDEMPQTKEFIIPTRNESVIRQYFDRHELHKDAKIIPYTIEGGFNVSKALNIATREAQYPNTI